jgi:pyruvate-formate lyase-activating enzyme
MGWKAKMNDEMTGLVLETSASCQLHCPHCFLRSYSERPAPALMPRAVVEALAPYLAGLESIDLTGWGEPLLNPELFELIALIRATFRGRLSMTTNGLLLDADKIERLVGSGLDVICVSIDAATPESYLRARPGGDFARLGEVLGLLVRARAARGGGGPLLFTTFLLRREALPELAGAAGFAARIGLDGIILQQLTGVFSERGLAQVTHQAYYRNRFDEAELTAAVARARAAAPPGFTIVCPERVLPERPGGCGGFDLARPFITASGLVSACCAMAYPCALIRRDGRLEKTRATVFGDVLAAPLPEIWRDPGYAAVRAQIRAGGPSAACGDCIALYLRPGEVWTAP